MAIIGNIPNIFRHTQVLFQWVQRPETWMFHWSGMVRLRARHTCSFCFPNFQQAVGLAEATERVLVYQKSKNEKLHPVYSTLNLFELHELRLLLVVASTNLTRFCSISKVLRKPTFRLKTSKNHLLHQPTFANHLLHKSAFTQNSFYTDKFLVKPHFTQTTFYTNQLYTTPALGL